MTQQSASSASSSVATRQAKQPENLGRRMYHRYSDAYEAAAKLEHLGDIFRILGIVLGAVVGLVLIFASFLRGLICGLAVWLDFYITGLVLIRIARAQHASIDASVQTSPWLTNEEKARLIIAASNK